MLNRGPHPLAHWFLCGVPGSLAPLCETPQPPSDACPSSLSVPIPTQSRPRANITSPPTSGQPSRGMPIANAFTSSNGRLSYCDCKERARVRKVPMMQQLAEREMPSYRFGAPTLCHSSFQHGRRLRMDSESPYADGCASLALTASPRGGTAPLTVRRLQSSANSQPNTRSGSAHRMRRHRPTCELSHHHAPHPPPPLH